MWRKIWCLLFPVAVWACDPPEELTIYLNGTGDNVTLRWSASDCPFYRVWYAFTPGGTPTLLAVVSDTSHVTQVNTPKRFFWVTSVNADSVESALSNAVGYVRILCGFNPAPGIQTVSTAFGLPFKFWYVPSAAIPSYGMESTKPSDIFGDQLHCNTTMLNADRILRPDNGNAAYRPTWLSCAYTGALQTDAIWNRRMIPGRVFYYQNRTEVTRYLVLAGQIDTSGVYAPSPEAVTLLSGAFSEYSWRDSRSLPRIRLNLISTGLTHFRVVVQDGSGNNFWYWNGQWQGIMSGVDPAQAYWIQNLGATATYDYDAGGNP
jgi:hypothetical protein